MKINDLVKQLNALKKQHGNLDVGLINGETGYTDSIKDMYAAHPPGANGCADRTKPAVSIVLLTHNRLP